MGGQGFLVVPAAFQCPAISDADLSTLRHDQSFSTHPNPQRILSSSNRTMESRRDPEAGFDASFSHLQSIGINAGAAAEVGWGSGLMVGAPANPQPQQATIFNITSRRRVLPW